MELFANAATSPAQRVPWLEKKGIKENRFSTLLAH